MVMERSFTQIFLVIMEIERMGDILVKVLSHSRIIGNLKGSFITENALTMVSSIMARTKRSKTRNIGYIRGLWCIRRGHSSKNSWIGSCGNLRSLIRTLISL